MAIKVNHPVREAFSSCSTGNDQGCYYSTKGHAINMFDDILQEYDLCLNREAWVDYNGDSGRENHEICDEFGKVVGCAIFSWYRTESGRYEFIGYIA